MIFFSFADAPLQFFVEEISCQELNHKNLACPGSLKFRGLVTLVSCSVVLVFTQAANLVTV